MARRGRPPVKGRGAGKGARAPLAERRRTRIAAAKATKTAKLGAGTRFAAAKRAVMASLRPGAIRPGQTREEAAEGIVARAGRKKYGKKRFQAMAIAGRKRARRKAA